MADAMREKTVLSGIQGLKQRQALNGIVALFLGFQVVFRASFLGILGGIHGLKQRQALNGIVALFLGFQVVFRASLLGF